MTRPSIAVHVAVHDGRPHGWTLVIPFKGAPDGKGRMAERFGVAARSRLAEAFLRDVLTAAGGVPAVRRILVVSGAPGSWIGSDASEGSAEVEIVPDRGGGLNPAVLSGIAAARDRDADAWIAVLTGDLPVMRPADLDEGLRLASEQRRSVVADKEGTGTTMLAATAGVRLDPHFGVGSLAAHEAEGHVRLDVPASSGLRFDVDTPADLDAARSRLWLGPATREVLEHLA